MTTPILFVDHAPALGGAEHSLLMLLRHLNRERWEPHLAGVDGPLLASAGERDVVTHELAMPRLRRSVRFPLDWAATARALADLAERTGAVALYANTVRASFYTAPAAYLAGRPFVWHMRDFWLSESKPRFTRIDTALKWLLCRTAAHVITNSRAVAAHLPSTDNITVVHNGIELEEFDPTLNGDLFREAHKLPTNAPLVGMVGRLRPWKGHTRFLKMAARVCTEIAEARFVIVGGSPFGSADGYEQELQRVLLDLHLDEYVVFTGHLDNVAPALAAMDVFVHPGDPEPFGLVNIEAMAMKTPVVAFAHGALPEIVADSETGLLVPPDDVHALAEAVTQLLREPARARRLGEAGRRRVKAQFTIERTAGEIERILARVI